MQDIDPHRAELAERATAALNAAIDYIGRRFVELTAKAIVKTKHRTRGPLVMATRQLAAHDPKAQELLDVADALWRDLVDTLEPGTLRRAARRYTGHAKEEDFTGEAWWGAFRAAERWDPTQAGAAPFPNYAAPWMRSAVTRARHGEAVVKITGNRIAKIGHAEKLRGQGLTEAQVSRRMGRAASSDSYRAPVHVLMGSTVDGNEGLSVQLCDGGKSAEDVQHAIAIEQSAAVLWPALDAIPDRRAASVLRALVTREGVTGASIGREMNLSRERVRQLKNAAVKRLREDPAILALGGAV